MKSNKENLIKEQKKEIFKEFKINSDLKTFLLAVSKYWIIAFIIATVGNLIIEILYPTTSKPFTKEGILTFLTICAGVGWIFHGTGFIIVRR